MVERTGHTQVVVIGSGFGGAIAAARLAEGGVPTVLLERGPWRDTVPVRSLGIARRTSFPRGHKLITQLLRTVNFGWLPGGRVTLSKVGLYEVFSNPKLNVVCSSNVGGGSHIYSASHCRPLVADYWEGHADGLSTAMMEPHYEAVLARMGSVTPTAAHRIPNTMGARFANHPTLGPMPPPPGAKVGYLLPEDPDHPRKITTPDGIERYEYDYRHGDGGFLGCPSGGKTTLDVVYLAPAMRAGLEVRDLAEVRLITRCAGAEPARYRIDYFDHHARSLATIHAADVILAAGTMNTLRILMASRAAGSLTGMPNLGKCFGTNGDYFGWWDWNEPGLDLTVGLPSAGGVMVRGEEKPPMIGGGGWPSASRYPLPKRMRERIKRTTFIAGLGEDAMDGLVSFADGRLSYDYDPDHSPIFAKLRQTFDRISELSGRKIHYRQRPTTVHPSGGCCLGASIDTAVIDANGEVFDHPGLFVTDASALPRAPGGPPSITIGAWSNHVAERYLARWRAGQTSAPE